MRWILVVTLFGLVGLAQANPIYYEVENLGGDRWQYSYTLENTTAIPIDWFSLYFDIGADPSNPVNNDLVITGSPGLDWDDSFFSFAAQPDSFLPDDGFVDFASIGAAIEPGASLSGFGVEFDYFGAGAPGAQFFTINAEDPLSFEFVELSSGFTQRAPTTAVPDPTGAALLGLGLLAMLRRRRVVANIGALHV